MSDAEQVDIADFLDHLCTASLRPEAHESAKMLANLYKMTAAEIRRLREERRWVPVGERLPEKYQRVIVAFTPDSRGVVEVCEAVHDFGSDFETDAGCYECSHWMPLPPGPEVPNG